MSVLSQDLSKLNYKQLKSAAAEIDQALKSTQRATAAKIAQIAEDTDIKLDELKALARATPVARNGNGTHAAPETRKPAPQKASPAKKATVHKPGTVQFRNPEDPKQVWTGRGPKPRWMQAKLAAGASMESLRV